MDRSDESWRHLNIGRFLNNAVNRFENRVLELMAEAGHGEARYSHLNLTRNLDVWGTRTTELARRAGMTKQAMGEIVEQCERLGLIVRRPDPTDARAKIVVFTDAGQQWLDAFRGALETAEQEMRDEIGYLRVDAIASALAVYGASHDPLGAANSKRTQ